MNCFSNVMINMNKYTFFKIFNPTICNSKI